MLSQYEFRAGIVYPVAGKLVTENFSDLSQFEPLKKLMGEMMQYRHPPKHLQDELDRLMMQIIPVAQRRVRLRQLESN